MRRQAFDAQRSQAIWQMAERASEGMLVKKGKIETCQGEGLDVVEGGELAGNPCQGVRDDPLERVGLSEVQITDVATTRAQAGAEPLLEAGEGMQLDGGEKVTAAPVDPSGRDEGTGEKALGIPTEYVDYFLDEL